MSFFYKWLISSSYKNFVGPNYFSEFASNMIRNDFQFYFDQNLTNINYFLIIYIVSLQPGINSGLKPTLWSFLSFHKENHPKNVLVYNLLKYLCESFLFKKTLQILCPSLALDTGCKLTVQKMLRRRPERLLNALCTFNLRPMSRGVWDKRRLIYPPNPYSHHK